MTTLNRRISRRQLLKLLGIGAGTAILSACAPQAAPTAAPAPTTAAAEATAAPTLAPEEATAAAATPTPGGNAAASAGGNAADIAETWDIGQQAFGGYDVQHPSNPVTLTVWAWSGDQTDPWVLSELEILKEFQQKYPEIKLDIQPTPTDLDTKVNAAIAAKQGPDILYESDREAEYPRRGVIRDIPEEVIPMDFIKKHNFYQVRPLDDGKLYWIHCRAMGPIIYANKALLAEAGLKPTDVPKTWEEFGKFAQQLTKASGGQMSQAGFAFNGYARYIWDDMMYQQKAHVYTKDKSFIDSNESYNAWQMLVDMYDRFKVNDRTFLNYDEAFGTGKAAMTQVWTWFGATLEANYPDVDWVPVTYPTFTGEGPYGRFDYDGISWMVTTLAEGDRMLAGYELMKFTAHQYKLLVDSAHTEGSIFTAVPHPDYEKMFSDVAAVEQPTQEQRRTQSLGVLARQFQGGMVFPGEVAAPFDDMWKKMEEAILLNREPIKDVLKQYQGLYDEMLKQTHFWITPEA